MNPNMLSAEAHDIDLENEGLGSKLWRKSQNNPFLTVGILGFLSAVGIGAYRFKNRDKKFPISLYVIQLRVAAQSVVIGSITVGMAYNMLNEYVFKDKKSAAKPLGN